MSYFTDDSNFFEKGVGVQCEEVFLFKIFSFNKNYVNFSLYGYYYILIQHTYEKRFIALLSFKLLKIQKTSVTRKIIFGIDDCTDKTLSITGKID